MAARRLRTGDEVNSPAKPLRRPAGAKASPQSTSKSSVTGDPVKEVVGAALRLLASRPRSEQELKRKLLQKYAGRMDDVDQCMVRLKEMGLIDDARMAESYAAYRTSTRPLGPSRIAQELVNRKVPRKIVESTVGKLYDGTVQEELIDRAIEKRLRTHGYGREGDDRRLLQHLARLGFEYDLIVRKILNLRKQANRGGLDP